MTEQERRHARRMIALGWAHICRAHLEKVFEAINRGRCDFDACSALIEAAQQVFDAADWLPIDTKEESTNE